MDIQAGPSVLVVPPAFSLRNAMASAAGRIDKHEVVRRAGIAMERKRPTFRECGNDSTDWAIIGGGPSLNDHWDVIRDLKKHGVRIVSVNKSHDALLDHGIVPWAHILLDPKEWVADYVKRPRMDVRYLVASQCHERTFAALEGYSVFLWHAGQDFEDGEEPGAYLKAYWPNTPWYVLPGPTTVGLRAMNIGHGVGVDNFHLIGLDSSRANGKLHAYDKPESADAISGATSGMFRLRNQGYAAKFDTNSHMLKQLYDFDEIMRDLPKHHATGQFRKEFAMTVYGSGLLPFYAATIGLHADPSCNEDPMKVGGYWQDSSVFDMSAAIDLPIFDPLDFGDMTPITMSFV